MRKKTGSLFLAMFTGISTGLTLALLDGVIITDQKKKIKTFLEFIEKKVRKSGEFTIEKNSFAHRDMKEIIKELKNPKKL